MNNTPRNRNVEALLNYFKSAPNPFECYPKKYRPKPGRYVSNKKYEIIDFEIYEVEEERNLPDMREIYQTDFFRGIVKKHRKSMYDNNPAAKLSYRLRASIWFYFNRIGGVKKEKTEKILGCTFEEFKAYIEAKWEPWMNWDNYGNRAYEKGARNKSWDLDHIIPVSTAKTEEDVIRLNHYTNFQPLCSFVNRHIKRDNVSIN